LKWLECIFKPVAGIAGENLDWSSRSHRLEITITTLPGSLSSYWRLKPFLQEKMWLSGYVSWSITTRIWTIFAHFHDLTDLHASEMCFLYGDLYECNKCYGKLYRVCFSCACEYVRSAISDKIVGYPLLWNKFLLDFYAISVMENFRRVLVHATCDTLCAQFWNKIVVCLLGNKFL